MTHSSQDQNLNDGIGKYSLLPFLLFLAAFLGSGVYFTLQGVEFAFYQISGPVCTLPAIALTLLLGKGKVEKKMNDFVRGASSSTIISMCFIFLLANAFAVVAKETGAAAATVSIGMELLPPDLVIVGLFLVSAFISLAMGTSMGTISAVAPIGYEMLSVIDVSPYYIASAIISGAMFGDNLSVISDTTIAATETQGCKMSDKFKQNIRWSIPAAILTAIIFLNVNGTYIPQTHKDSQWLMVLPYLAILAMAVRGLSVHLTLFFGIVLIGSLAMLLVPDYSLVSLAKDIGKGFAASWEVSVLSMFVGGLGAFAHKEGGLDFLVRKIELIGLSNSLEEAKPSKLRGVFSIGSLVSFVNACTANNTVAILLSGQSAKTLAQKYGLKPRESASVLDIFSCTVQGLIPYGAQLLLLGSILKLSPLDISFHSYYVLILAGITLAALGAQLLFKSRSS